MAQERVQVLVFDQDEDIRVTTHIALENEGYDVLEAATTREALDNLRASPGPLVVLFNNVLPEFGNGAFFRAVLADESVLRQHAYVCFTVDPARIPPELLDALARLAIPILTKPFDLSALFATIRHAAERLPAMARASRASSNGHER